LQCEEKCSMDGFQKLANENEKLKEFQLETQKNLREILETRKDYLLKTYAINNQNGKNEQIIKNLKNFQLLKTENHFKVLSIIRLEEVLAAFNENLKRFKHFFLFFNENSADYQTLNDNEFEFKLNEIKDINELKNLISVFFNEKLNIINFI